VLTFDERLALAALAVDARMNTRPLNLADVIRLPEAAPIPLTPTSAPCPYRTPIAATLHRARTRIERDGWLRGARVDQVGARCLDGAIRVEAPDRHTADDAVTLLLEAIQRDFPTVETVPSWNDAQTSAAPVLLQLGRAAELAHNRGL
jgi:hypothetical protein